MYESFILQKMSLGILNNISEEWKRQSYRDTGETFQETVKCGGHNYVRIGIYT